MTDTHWSADTDDDGIVWIRFDHATGSANVLSSEVLLELNEMFKAMTQTPPRGVVIYSGKANGFIMGADIKEFTGMTSPERTYELAMQGHELFDRLESLPCPSVAAINGFCLGGGLELSMACQYRLALTNPKPILGLPEVQLGLHPGFGGTVRIINICGVRAGMQIQLTGKPITVDKGRKIGLIDRIATEDNWRQAAKELIGSGRPKQKAPLMDRILGLGLVRPFIKKSLIAQVRSKANPKHYPAPYAMIDLWAKYGASVSRGYEAEARSFANLMATSTAQNLIRVFFLQNALKSQGNKPEGKIKNVHVVGAGVMGGDIAAYCAYRGLNVTLQDREQQYIDPAIERAHKMYAKRIRDDERREATMARLKSDVDGAGVADADLIIEAIYENQEAKQELYAKLEKDMKPGALLATNTSSIPLQELRTNLREPQRFIGLHFFNPVAQLPLVEVVRCDDTEQSALDSGFAFVKGIGKFPLECGSAPGFVVNRILGPYMAEAMRLAEDGVAIEDIDRVAVDFGMPMGPVELVDSVGLDVALHVSKVIGGSMEGPVGDRITAMVEQGQLGRKSGQGFYTWVNGKAQKSGAPRGDVPEDAEDRLILNLVNESVSVLADGVVTDADLLDAGVIFGTGFAPFRGGPLNYAKERGMDEVIARLRELAGRHGERFEPHSGFGDL
ncbi:MAG: 3-hydroxyacyl-CoA dehydrogenase NAD-binding domain-containing protein [Pseudomonadota bacterium]